MGMVQEQQGHRHYGYHKDKQALLRRLRRIEGQVRGIQRMVEEDRYCVDILQQVEAVSAALKEVGLMVLEDHVEGCVADAVRSGNGESTLKELMHVIRKSAGR